MILGAIFTALFATNAYVFFFRGGTSVQELLKTGSIQQSTEGLLPPSARAKSKASKPASGKEKSYLIVTGKMEGQLGLSSALAAAHLNQRDADALIDALKPHLDLRALRPEQTFEIRLDPATNRLHSFRYRVSTLLTIEAQRAPGGKLKAHKIEAPVDTRITTVGGRIESSLEAAMTGVGESATLVSKFVALFNWDINWFTDPRAGDTFRLLVEKHYVHGRLYKTGRILAAEYQNAGKTYQAYLFKDRSGRTGYYTEKGRSVRRELLRTPLRYRRISSRYQKKRMHPILHHTRGHFGVDYAAPSGTPVWAAASGVVVSASRTHGGGNTIVLRHGRSLTTHYLHLRRFARGIRAGKRVSQGQVIGYVGSTGLATGPHLHYAIKINGRYVDPLKYRAHQGEPLPRSERRRFLTELPARKRALAAVSSS